MLISMLSLKSLPLAALGYIASYASCASALANGVDLRILPLGDSITWGYSSSDGNGYRKYLYNRLGDNFVDYVGTQQSGNMADNDNEGHPGAVIKEIAGYAANILYTRPNIVLVMAGTNDCNSVGELGDLPDQLGRLIDEITDACPGAAVIVAQLTPIDSAHSESVVQQFNAAIPGLVSARVNAGKKVLTVNMSDSLTTGDLADRLHPNDRGYDKMSQVWYSGIESAASFGWIQAPV
ncbi:SGNH hydrolase-type esterase domain-containing protein [Aspergillus keveii]|uniref:SGNH hydrolase-type esterase domain-containing protein n=1 Tax=Aspergillus keveii TaxID=714993 RepID=A0ABR4FY81_9EURO